MFAAVDPKERGFGCLGAGTLGLISTLTNDEVIAIRDGRRSRGTAPAYYSYGYFYACWGWFFWVSDLKKENFVNFMSLVLCICFFSSSLSC